MTCVRRTVESLGLQLTVRVTSLAPSPSPSATAPLIVFVGGLLLSLLAGWLAVVLVLSRRRALHLADEAIAELRVSEDEMRKSAARFASLVRRSSDVIAIVDTSGVVEFVTPSIERLLALPPARIEGTSLFDYVVFDEQHVLHELLDQLTAGHEVVTPGRARVAAGGRVEAVARGAGIEPHGRPQRAGHRAQRP